MTIKKIITTVLVFTMLIVGYNSIFNIGLAAVVNPGDAVHPQYTYTRTVTAQLIIDRSGRATCTGKVGLYDKNSTVSLTVRLLKKSGNTWITVKKWSDSRSGSLDYSLSKEYTVTSGAYKVRVSGTVTTNSGKSEVVSKSTSEQSFMQ